MHLVLYPARYEHVPIRRGRYRRTHYIKIGKNAEQYTMYHIQYPQTDQSVVMIFRGFY